MKSQHRLAVAMAEVAILTAGICAPQHQQQHAPVTPLRFLTPEAGKQSESSLRRLKANRLPIG
jgi:hypothetical protein